MLGITTIATTIKYREECNLHTHVQFLLLLLFHSIQAVSLACDLYWKKRRKNLIFFTMKKQI